MKIAILADSLALPREDVGGDELLEVTYPFLLDQSLRRQFGAGAPIIFERGMRRRTIEYVLDEWNELVELRKPQIVIVHVGIVDCAPRVFLRREASFVANIRFASLRERIFKFTHDHRRRIVQFRRKVYVPLPRFERLVQQVVQKARETEVRSLVFINIIRPPDTVEERSPGFQSNVIAYNQVLQDQTKHDFVSVIDLNRLVHDQGGPETLMVDGIHLNERGHVLLAQQLETQINAEINPDLVSAIRG
ncbi:MAG TPA: SGNH/GDSL hydrolase family protein [Pyrinomonadaceae bacterium]|jgi:lysophospholipase L1-like esterase|nr:SGNH/GDSL hydrolase family protein [Pyrinomonadaceae bacterium]